jgi:hypothetical protein
MTEDELYDMRREEELGYIQDYFVYHIYKLNVHSNQITSSSNWKQDDKYIIEMTLKPNGAKLRLEIPRDYYDKINRIVMGRDTSELKFEEIDKEVK